MVIMLNYFDLLVSIQISDLYNIIFYIFINLSIGFLILFSNSAKKGINDLGRIIGVGVVSGTVRAAVDQLVNTGSSNSNKKDDDKNKDKNKDKSSDLDITEEPNNPNE